MTMTKLHQEDLLHVLSWSSENHFSRAEAVQNTKKDSR